MHCVEGETCAQKLTEIISAVVKLLKLYPGGAVPFGLYWRQKVPIPKGAVWGHEEWLTGSPSKEQNNKTKQRFHSRPQQAING